MMAPRQQEAGAAPADLPLPIEERFDDHHEEFLFADSDDDDDDENGDEGDEIDGAGGNDLRDNAAFLHRHPLQPQLNQQQRIPQQRQRSPQEMSLLAEIGAKFESLGVDLVRHIVVASIPSQQQPLASPPPPPPLQPSPDHPPANAAPPTLAAPFPPSSGGVHFINLLTTDRETLTMRRLVTKALIDKSHSFNAMIYILPRIPARTSEFRDIFGAVVDRMIRTSTRRRDDDDNGDDNAVNNDDNVTNVTWGKVVTAYAFGLRLIKAAADVGAQPLQQQQHHQQQQHPAEAADADQEAPEIAPVNADEFDHREWGSALGQVMHERMGDWVLSRGGWSDGFNDYFLDRRGLEDVVTKKLFYVFAVGVGLALFLKLVRK